MMTRQMIFLVAVMVTFSLTSAHRMECLQETMEASFLAKQKETMTLITKLYECKRDSLKIQVSNKKEKVSSELLELLLGNNTDEYSEQISADLHRE